MSVRWVGPNFNKEKVGTEHHHTPTPNAFEEIKKRKNCVIEKHTTIKVNYDAAKIDYYFVHTTMLFQLNNNEHMK